MFSAGASQNTTPYSLISRLTARPISSSKGKFQVWARAAATGKLVTY